MGRFDNQNFTDKNKSVKQPKPTGCNDLIRENWENGYGGVAYDKIMNGTGSATYDSQSMSASPINYSGMDNFSDNSRFTGDMGGQVMVQASSSGKKDSIETMGKSDEAVTRRM